MKTHQDESVEFKRDIKSFLNEEAGTIGYRKKFFREQTERLLAFLEGKVVPPYELEVQPSSTCNVQCSHCFSRKTIKKRLSNELKRGDNIDVVIKKILEAEAWGLRVESIKFVGTSGDPLCNKKTLDVIGKVKESGRQAKLFTNGVGLSYRQNGTEYLKYLCNLDYMRLSLDAGSARTWNKIKGVNGDSFMRILGSIKKLSNLRDKNKSELDIQI